MRTDSALVVSVVFLCAAAVLFHTNNAQDIRESQLRRENFIVKREKEMHKDLLKRESELTNFLMRQARASSPKSVNRTYKTNQDDIDALKALYNATDGPNWNNNTGWLKGDPCNPFWYGVYCVNGRILQINLVFNGLAGPLPATLAKASALQVFRAYSNRLSGNIPVEIFNMNSLQIFDVNSNILSGTLPSTISMANLVSLSLYANNIEGGLPSVWDTPNLQEVELSSNTFTGELPQGLSKCTNLTELVVSRNMITGTLPESYGDLSKLQQFWTFYNNLDSPSIPVSYRGMKSLKDLQADSLVGEFPSWIGNSWRNLQNLVLVNGKLTGQIPESICDCTNLQVLRIFNNSLHGSVPRCICELRSVTDLELSDNNITGLFPDCLGDMRSLEMVVISRTNVEGQIPDNIGNLVNLSLFDISSNRMTGNVPSSLNNLQEIAGFFISYNKFSTFSDGLGQFFSRIKQYGCGMYTNPWSCPIPSEVPKECQAQCSKCNSGDQHTYCSSCIKDSSCGWCSEGQNCLEGSAQGPENIYKCYAQQWIFGSSGSCP